MKDYFLIFKKYFFSQQGDVPLLVTFLILANLLIIGLGLAAVNFLEIRMSEDEGQSVKAFYAADAGVEWCIYQIWQKGLDCDSGEVVLGNGAIYDVVGGIIIGDKGMLNSLGYNDAQKKISRKINLGWE